LFSEQEDKIIRNNKSVMFFFMISSLYLNIQNCFQSLYSLSDVFLVS